MLTKFDAELNKIQLNGKNFFQLHPELLPHIGDDYERFKILIIAESHYLPENFADKARYFMEWYDTSTDEIGGLLSGVVNNWDEAVDWFTTRVANSFSYKVEKYFLEVMREFNLVDGDNFDILDYVAFFNYYQRPNLLTARGFQTIFDDDREDRYACEISKQVIDVIRPNLVLILSKRCSDSFSRNYGAPLPENIKCFPYPNHYGYFDESKFKETIGEFFQRFSDDPGNKEIFNQINNAISNLDDLEETIRSNGENIGGGGHCNTYPYGVPTNKIFPRFHAICFGKERLGSVLGAIIEQCHKMISHFGNATEKIVILDTDKWNEDIFSYFKPTFEKFAKKSNVNFEFHHCTEDGKKTVWATRSSMENGVRTVWTML